MNEILTNVTRKRVGHVSERVTRGPHLKSAPDRNLLSLSTHHAPKSISRCSGDPYKVNFVVFLTIGMI